jgi:hypothetical protein
MRRLGVLVAALVIAPATAHAGRIAVLAARAEADLTEHAGAVTLLLRSAVAAIDQESVPAPELAQVALPIAVPAELARGMHRLDADVVIACDLVRSGVTIQATVLAVDRTGAVVAAGMATAGDGDVSGLTRGVLDVLGRVVSPGRQVPTASVGQLRPFLVAADAIERGDYAAAARAVVTAEPFVALRVRAIPTALRPAWAGAAADQATALSIALVAASPKEVLDLAPGPSPRERGARALAKLGGAALEDAARELTGRGRDPLLDVAAARLAYSRGEVAKTAAAIERLLTGSGTGVIGAALVASLPAGAVSPVLEDRALTAAQAEPRFTRVASVLGLRAARRGQLAALAVVKSEDLDDVELTQLEPVAAQASAEGLRDGRRLLAELAARRADPVAVSTAIKAWLAAAVDDPAAQLLRGRLALAAARLDEARDAFTAARAERELARVAAARRDWATAARLLDAVDDRSLEKRLVAAQLALGRGDTAAAQTAIDDARALAPASAEALRARAVILEARGDATAAAADRALADRFGPGQATAIDLTPRAGSGAPGPGPDPGSGTAAPTATDVALATTATGDRLTRELQKLLGPLEVQRAKAVAVIGVRADGPPWWSLRAVETRPVPAALTAALRGLGVEVVTGAPAWVSEPFDPDRLSTVASEVGATHLLLYRLTTDGDRATVRLILFERGVVTARGFEGGFDGVAAGVIHWNHDRLITLGIAAALLVLVGVFWLVRGRSRIVVTIERDPDGSDEVLAIEISRSPRRPALPDPAAWRKDSLRIGHQHSATGARLPSDRTVFRVAPGSWHVHVYGVYTREFGDRVVPPLHSKAVDVRRGAQVEVGFDLGLPVAEVKVTIHDEKRQGVAVWLDDAQADKLYTDASGQATLYATIGQHTLWVDPGDLRIEKPLPIAAAKIEKIAINLPRERRLAEVSEGLTLSPGELRAAEPVEPAPMDEPIASSPTVASAAASPAAATAAARPPPRPESGRPEPVVIAPVVASAPTQMMGAPPPPAVAATAGTSQRITAVTDAVTASTVLGRYRLDAEVGAGAMGVVYRAWDLHLERTVAVKVMARAVREIPDALAFFLQEAKALAQLNHPNIVAVYDQLTDGLEQYMIMEFVDGITVEKLLADRGRLSVRQALGLTDQLCTGLAYAHGKKVIHRDIKPANIFVSRERVAKLGDFGLARVMREIEIRQTDVRGTPLYMAPEQVSGTNISHRADLYAVGCTLFELCAGRPPFVDGNILHHHLVTEPPRLSTLCPEAPPALDELVAACLTKDSARRIESAAAISERVRAIAARL